MNRQILLPPLGFVTVFGALLLGGAFEGVPPADRAGAFLLGLVAVATLVAGYSFATRRRDDGDGNGGDEDAEAMGRSGTATGPGVGPDTGGDREP